MKSNAGTIVWVLKRLKAAVGYHELGMTEHALRCLDSLASRDKIGPFCLVAEVLRGEFVSHAENHILSRQGIGDCRLHVADAGQACDSNDAGRLLRPG